MKAFAVIILACIIISLSIIALHTFAYGEPSVDVKKGDWIEYTISIQGLSYLHHAILHGIETKFRR